MIGDIYNDKSAVLNETYEGGGGGDRYDARLTQENPGDDFMVYGRCIELLMGNSRINDTPPGQPRRDQYQMSQCFEFFKDINKAREFCLAFIKGEYYINEFNKAVKR